MAHTGKYKLLEHPSDIKIQAYGRDLPDLFINMATGMMEYIYGKTPIQVETTEPIEIVAENFDSLLVNWLAKILTLSSINHHAYVLFTIEKFKPQQIVAKIGSRKAQAHHEIKAVTYHELNLSQTKDGWEATVVFDI